MAALLLIAHGSRKAEANEEIARLAERVEHRGAGDYSAVQAAFLELAEPDICAGIDCLVERGADEIVVVPYFLARGRHVARDIPEELERAIAGVETDFVRSLERVGGFGGKADRLNEYHFFADSPGWVRHDLRRYRSVRGEDVVEAARTYLVGNPAVWLSVVPRGREDLAAGSGPTGEGS